MEKLKVLEQRTWQLNQAVTRYIERIEREQKQDNQLLEMISELLAQVNEQAEALKTAARIAPEQVDADTTLLNKLEESVNAWNAEYELIQKELIDQAIIDAKEGTKSSRYLALEKREADLKKLIVEGEEKLGKVAGRIISPEFGNTIQQVVNNLKPHNNANT